MSSYPSYSSPPPSRPLGSGMAVAALILGIVALLFFWTVVGGALLGPIAIVLGVIALRRVRRGIAAGRGMAIAGVITGTLGLLLSVVFVVLSVWVFNSSGARTLTECLTDAGGDQAQVDQCRRDFERELENGS